MFSVKELKRIMINDEAEEDLMHAWDRICFRLDICSLIITQLINVFLAGLWFFDT
jgi:hypothetical protein